MHSIKISKIFKEKAIEEALKSNYSHKIGAVIFKNKSIIAYGHNFSCRSAKHLHPRFQKAEFSIHAEVAAILKARCDLTSCSCLVVRVNKVGELKLAKPCKYCQSYLTYVGIKNIYYSDQEAAIRRLY